MSRMWEKARLGKVLRNLTCIFILVSFAGYYGIADNQSNANDEAARLANEFAKQLADSLRDNREFQDAVAGSPGCAVEIADLIVAQFALDQAQHDYDIAYQALEECIMALPDPDPMPDPETPETLPTNGEFSVLVR